MIRKYINRLEKSGKDNITWRSNEPMRIEAFSDGVFAFAVSLSVISLEVPHSFNELLDMMRGFLPFVLCYSGLFMVWLSQHKFFRRYGMKDEVTVALNAILLLMVLFFIYPLKFLFSSLYLPDKYIMKKDEFNSVFIMYGSGVAVIYLLFTMMYITVARNK